MTSSSEKTTANALLELHELLKQKVVPGELANWTSCVESALQAAQDAAASWGNDAEGVDDRATATAITRLLTRVRDELAALTKSWSDDFQQAETLIQLGRTQQVGQTVVAECLELVSHQDDPFAASNRG